MSVTEILIKLGGAVLAFIGFALLLSVVNVPVFGIAFTDFGKLGEFIMGIIMLGLGIYIVRGGTPHI